MKLVGHLGSRKGREKESAFEKNDRRVLMGLLVRVERLLRVNGKGRTYT